MSNKTLTILWNRLNDLNRTRKNIEEKQLVEAFVELFEIVIDNFSTISNSGKLVSYTNMLERYLVALEQSEIAKLYNN